MEPIETAMFTWTCAFVTNVKLRLHRHVFLVFFIDFEMILPPRPLDIQNKQRTNLNNYLFNLDFSKPTMEVRLINK